MLAAVVAPQSLAAFTPHAYAAPVYVGVEGGSVAVSYFDGEGMT